MRNNTEKAIKINTLSDLLFLLNNNLEEIRFYLSSDLLKEGTISSISYVFRSILSSIPYGENHNSKGYSIQTLYIDGVKYYDVEKRNLINEEERKIVLNLLEEEFGESLKSVGVFGSYITKEDGKYSDYDLVVMLEKYKDSNIYEREKASPRLKEKLKKAGVQSLFAFNFTTIEELENAHKTNPWLLETMGKSFYILKDSDNKLEEILTKDRGIEYLGNFVWKGESLNTKENLKRIDDILTDYKNILAIAIRNNNTDFIAHYEWEIKKLEITKKLLEEQSLFVSRFDFDFICKELLKLDDIEINNLFQVYKKASIEGKKTIQSYDSIKNNIDFSPYYLLKVLSGFNKKGIKCVSGNRASKVKGVKNKFHNFAFRKEDYETDGKDIFKHSLRNIGTTYFTS